MGSTHSAAAESLASADPVLASMVDLVGLPDLGKKSATNFSALVRSIVYQQLAGAAAGAIHARVVDALGGDVTPDAVLGCPEPTLRAAGLSGSKAASLRDLAERAVDGSVELDAARLRRRGDEEIVSNLSTVRGVGRWTAHMFLIFQLRRLDVWPTGDLGVRRGYGLAWGVPMPSPEVLEDLGERFRPYRSVVAWYCWRACELCR